MLSALDHKLQQRLFLPVKLKLQTHEIIQQCKLSIKNESLAWECSTRSRKKWVLKVKVVVLFKLNDRRTIKIRNLC